MKSLSVWGRLVAVAVSVSGLTAPLGPPDEVSPSMVTDWAPTVSDVAPWPR